MRINMITSPRNLFKSSVKGTFVGSFLFSFLGFFLLFFFYIRSNYEDRLIPLLSKTYTETRTLALVLATPLIVATTTSLMVFTMKKLKNMQNRITKYFSLMLIVFLYLFITLFATLGVIYFSN